MDPIHHPFPTFEKLHQKGKELPQEETERTIFQKELPSPQCKQRQIKATVTMAALTTPATVAATCYLTTISILPASTGRTAPYETCSALGRSCPLFTLPAPIISPPHLNRSDMEEDWNGERKEKREKRKERRRNLKIKLTFHPAQSTCPIPHLILMIFSAQNLYNQSVFTVYTLLPHEYIYININNVNMAQYSERHLVQSFMVISLMFFIKNLISLVCLLFSTVPKHDS